MVNPIASLPPQPPPPNPAEPIGYYQDAFNQWSMLARTAMQEYYRIFESAMKSVGFNVRITDTQGVTDFFQVPPYYVGVAEREGITAEWAITMQIGYDHSPSDWAIKVQNDWQFNRSIQTGQHPITISSGGTIQQQVETPPTTINPPSNQVASEVKTQAATPNPPPASQTTLEDMAVDALRQMGIDITKDVFSWDEWNWYIAQVNPQWPSMGPEAFGIARGPKTDAMSYADFIAIAGGGNDAPAVPNSAPAAPSGTTPSVPTTGGTLTAAPSFNSVLAAFMDWLMSLWKK